MIPRCKIIAVILTLVFLTSLILPLGCRQNKTPLSSIFSIDKGGLLVQKAGSTDWIKGEVKMALKAGDSIKSGTEADAVITFFDGSTIELKADTQVEIATLVTGKAKIIQLKQAIGETISKVEKLTDPAARYEIETPSAVAGVRGSSMLVSVASDGVTIVQNLEGQISVTAQGTEVVIPLGGTGTVKPGETPVLELSYDDGIPDGGLSTGGLQKYGYMVTFEPLVLPFNITKIKIFSWIKTNPADSDQFTVRITDSALSPLWETSLPFTMFTTDQTWLEVAVPNITVNDNFCLQLYAPSLGQGLGPYIGADRSGTNKHSEELSDWQITPWTLQIPKEQTNWMIRVNGDVSK
jgi:hypothetical protein